MFQECFSFIEKKLNKELLKTNSEEEIQTEIIDKTNNTILFYKLKNNQKVVIDTAQGEYAEYAKCNYIMDSTIVADYYYRLAKIKTRQQKYDTAITLYEKAIDYDGASELSQIYYVELSDLYIVHKKDRNKGIEILNMGLTNIKKGVLLNEEADLLNQIISLEKLKQISKEKDKEIARLKKKISELK